MKLDIKNLRQRDVYRKFEDCLRQATTRDDAPICDFSVQGDHVDMLVDAANNQALTSAVRGVSIRVARAFNKFWGRKGRVFNDRYHARLLRSPTEVRPWPAVVVTRCHDSTTVPTGGAAQLVVPQRARGCAAVLCFLAVRSCKAPSYALGSGRCPFFKRHPHNRFFGGRLIYWARAMSTCRCLLPPTNTIVQTRPGQTYRLRL